MRPLYASYKLNKVVTVSARGEYLHSDPAEFEKFGASQTNVDDFSETLTVAFNIWDNLLTRVEYRYDHVVNGANYNTSVTGAGTFTNVYGNPTYADQNEVSLEAVYSF